MNASFINCCAAPIHYITYSFCPATLNGVLRSCLQKSKFYRGGGGGFLNPPNPPPPPSLRPWCYHLNIFYFVNWKDYKTSFVWSQMRYMFILLKVHTAINPCMNLACKLLVMVGQGTVMVRQMSTYSHP